MLRPDDPTVTQNELRFNDLRLEPLTVMDVKVNC